MQRMFFVVFFLFILNFPALFSSLTGSRCFWRTKHSGNNEVDLRNDCFYIIFLRGSPLPKDDVTDDLFTKWPKRRIQHVLTMIFALEEINRDSRILPNMSLNLFYYSSLCSNFSLLPPPDSLQDVFANYPNYDCVTSECSIALTGPTWTSSARLGPLLQLYIIPQISYGPFHPILSDRDNFPYLHQVAPKDTFLPLAMVSLMLHFTWTWVGLVIIDDDQGIQFLSDLRAEMQRNGVCLSFVNVIPANMELYMTQAEMYYNQIVTSSANVVVIYGEMLSTLEVSFRRWEFLGIRRIWVTTSQWDLTTSKEDFIPDSFQGAFMFSHHHGEISRFKTFFQTKNFSKYPEEFFVVKLGWMDFNCSLSKSYCKTPNNCSSNPSLAWFPIHSVDLVMNDECYNIYNAVYATAHTLHEMILQQIDLQSMGKQLYLFNKTCMQINGFLKNVQFTNPIGDVVNVNQKGLLNDEYDILNIWNFPQNLGLNIKVGQFSPHFPHGQHLHISDNTLEWATGSRQIPPSVCSVHCSPGFRKSPQEGQASCCFYCSQCPINEISNETDMDHCMKCLDNQYANEDQTHCLQKSLTFLAYEDPLGMALACLALCFSALTALVLGVFWKHQETPIVKANNRTLSYILLISLNFCFLCSLLFIGHPNTATCFLQQITFGVLFTVAVSTVLAKTVTVVLAFKVTAPGRRMRGLLVSGTPNFIIPVFTLIQLILCAVWLGTSPPFVDTDAHSEHGHIIIFCNKGSVTAFYCALGYLGSLALVSFTVAFLARKLPDTFNEAKFLTFSMLVFLSVWVTFLPVYHSSRGKFLVAVEVFSILASSAGLLGCIFVPKCYIILLRPNRNSLEMFRNKFNS